MKALALGIETVDRAAMRAGHFDGAHDDRRQDLVEIERGGKRETDFLQRAELADRAFEIARALFDLLLELGVGVLELRGHEIEVVGEVFDLVAGPHLDLMAEIAFGQMRRAVAHGLDRHRHPARQDEPGADAEHERQPAG